MQKRKKKSSAGFLKATFSSSFYFLMKIKHQLFQPSLVTVLSLAICECWNASCRLHCTQTCSCKLQQHSIHPVQPGKHSAIAHSGVYFNFFLPGHCRGQQRSYTRSTCRGHSHCWPRFYGLLINTAHLSVTQATPSVGHKPISKSETLCHQNGRHAEHQPPHLVGLVDNYGVIGQRLHNVEVFNSS